MTPPAAAYARITREVQALIAATSDNDLDRAAGLVAPAPGMVLSLWRGWIDVSMSSIAAEVAARFGLTIEELKGRDEPVRRSRPRQEAAHRMRAIGRTFPQIARFMDRNHATIMRDVKLHEERLRREAGV